MFFVLVISDTGQQLNTIARDRADALAMFSKELGQQLSDKDDGSVAPYMLDEWTENKPHWLNPTIAIWTK